MSKNAHRHFVYTRDDYQEKVIVVALQQPEFSDGEISLSLDELERLVETLGGTVHSRCVQKRQRPSPATYIGKGKAREIAELVKEHNCSLVAFDCELSGGQQRNLETILCCRANN